MTSERETRCFSVPLVGCDGFLLGLEGMMGRAGQGRHVGLSVLKLTGAFSVEALRSAATRFSQSHPLLHARVRRRHWFGIPEWRATGPFSGEAVGVYERPEGGSVEAICRELLCTVSSEALRFEVIPRPGGVFVVVKWLHLLLDGRGIELALYEIARLAEHPLEAPCVQESWGAAFELPKTMEERRQKVRPFVERYNVLKLLAFKSLGRVAAEAGEARFKTLHFDEFQSEKIRARADHLTGGIFQLPYFFAVVARAHAAVFAGRGESGMNYHAAAPVQGRRRGAKHPIFQNQMSQFYFALTHEEVGNLETAAKSIHSQFGLMARHKVESAFLIMLHWFLRFPSRFYIHLLRRQTKGSITSFFHSHTGQFMPETQMFCGAQISDGWHIPTVSQPPGSGIFFSERNRCLTATLSWRDGVLSESEVELMCARLREDLLGGCE
ncbi:MAG: hypothetical protein DVB28_000391 [Verrucomicrobia bacterium]|nr:MAG: hypothetical protein DVB28_000391 [Verrucomicrobiota bacterium]